MSIPFKSINRAIPQIVQSPATIAAPTGERSAKEQARRDAMRAAKKERRRAHAIAHAAGVARRAMVTKSLDQAIADETRESIDGALAFIQRLHDKSGQSYRDVLHALLKFEAL